MTQTIPYIKRGMWGFTKDPERIEGVRQWIEEAKADGFVFEPTYPGEGRNGESVDRAGKGTKEGYTIQYLARDNRDQKDRQPFECSINIWCPKGISVDVPEFYSWEEIQANARTCPECGKTDVDTVRVAFANRACNDCAPALRAELEKPGWCD